MFVFSKGKLLTFNPICDRQNKTAGKPRFAAGGIRNKKGNMVLRNNAPEANDFGMRHNVWLMKTSSQEKPCCAIEHPATFPDSLAIDHIRSWSNKNDLVLDPMCGSGTTCLAAEKLGRNYIGIEISEKYCEVAKQRIKKEAEQGKLNL